MSKKLLAYPLIDELEYRQNIDSDQLNRMLHSIEESVLRTIIRGAEAQDMITRLNLATESSNIAMANMISSIVGIKDSISNTMFTSGFDTITAKAGSTFNNDRGAGHVTMPFVLGKNLSKVPRYDSDDDGIADTVSPSVKIRVDDIERPQGDPIYNMLNRRMDSFWVEQLGAGPHVIEIELPPSLNKKFNYIELMPLPVFGFDIASIEYYDLRSTALKLDRPRYVNPNGPQILHFAPKQFNNIIKINVVANATGVVGFSNVDIALVDYQNTAQTFYMPFSNIIADNYNLDVYLYYYIDQPNTTYSNLIKEVSLVSDTNDTLVSRLELKEYQTLTNIDIGSALYLKVTMQELDLTTPVMYGAKIIRS